MIFCIIVSLISLGVAILSLFTFAPLRGWYDFYFPILIFIGCFIIGIAITWEFISISGRYMRRHPEKYTGKAYPKFLLRQGIQFIDFLARGKAKVTGKDKLPQNQPFLLVQNHISNFDPMITYGSLAKQNIGFITKPKNMSIPLAKFLLPLLYFQPIDRDDKLQSLEVIRNCSKLLKDGVTCIGVYPEGTRHKDGIIGDFHAGVFSIATHANAPIVVTTITGSNHIAKNFPFKKTHIRLDIIGVIMPEDYEGMTTKDISNEVREMMQEHLEHLR